MKKEKVTTQRKICVANEVLEAVEKHVIARRKDSRYVVENILNYSYEYASQCFSCAFQISLGKYVNRRLLTETYRKNKDKYDGYKWNETVEGIKNFKRRMKTEFGDPIKQLQDRIKLDEIDDMIFDGEMRRFCKKEINKLEEERKEILAHENRILLVENGKVTIREWKTKMIKHNESYYVFHGELIEDARVVDTIFSNFISQTLYIPLKKEYPVEKILQTIADFHEDDKREISSQFDLSIEVLEEKGGWRAMHLIDQLTLSNDKKVKDIKLFARWLKWEGSNLYLYYLE